MASTTYQIASENQGINRNFLATGVRGVKCLFAGSAMQATSEVDEGQRNLLFNIGQGLREGEYIGTIELYRNGAMNVFHKEDGRVIGFWTYRP